MAISTFLLELTIQRGDRRLIQSLAEGHLARARVYGEELAELSQVLLTVVTAPDEDSNENGSYYVRSLFAGEWSPSPPLQT